MHYQKLLKEYVQPIINKIKKPRAEEVVEFEIYDGFDDADPFETIKNLVILYEDVLCDDPRWHFFNEGDFMVVRCSQSFVDKVMISLKNNGFDNYKGPKEWKEGTHVTREFKYEFFMNMFHQISEGVMMLLLNKDCRKDYDYFVKSVLERIVHAWCNHNMMAAISFGKSLKNPLLCQSWEAYLLSDLAIARARYGGMYEYLRQSELDRKKTKDSSKS